MQASFIESVLSEKHRRDFSVKQMRTGQSIGSNTYGIFDFWAMELSWKEKTIGYEIKVDRADFISDEKWNYYLPYCNQFYWICPHGLISKDEIDIRTGLIWVYEDGRMRTIKKALHRDIAIESSIYRYALMNKVHRIVPYNRQAEIRQYLSHKNSGNLSHEFKSKLVEENRELRDRINKLEKELKSRPVDVIQSPQIDKSDFIKSLLSIKTKVEHEIARLR